MLLIIVVIQVDRWAVGSQMRSVTAGAGSLLSGEVFVQTRPKYSVNLRGYAMALESAVVMAAYTI